MATDSLLEKRTPLTVNSSTLSDSPTRCGGECVKREQRRRRRKEERKNGTMSGSSHGLRDKSKLHFSEFLSLPLLSLLFQCIGKVEETMKEKEREIVSSSLRKRRVAGSLKLNEGLLLLVRRERWRLIFLL